MPDGFFQLWLKCKVSSGNSSWRRAISSAGGKFKWKYFDGWSLQKHSRILWFSCTILHVYTLDDEAGYPQQSEIEVTYGDTCSGAIILDTSLWSKLKKGILTLLDSIKSQQGRLTGRKISAIIDAYPGFL